MFDTTRLKNYSSNRIVINGAYGIAEMAIPFVLIFFTTPFLVTHLGAEGYGLWNVALAFLGLMGIFDFGVSAAVIKYVSEYYEQGNIEELSVAVTVSFVINSMLGIVLGTILYRFSNSFAVLFLSKDYNLQQIGEILKIASLGFFPMMIQNVALAIPRGFQEYRTATWVMVTQNFLTLLSAILIVYFGGTALQVMEGTIVIYWSTLIVSFSLGWRRLSVIGAKPRFKMSTLKKILPFTFFMGLTGVGVAIFSFLDRIVVGRFLGLSAVAYYTIATGVANKFPALASAITRSLMPAFSSWSVNADLQRLRQKYLKATFVVFLVILLPGIVFLFFSKSIVVLWLGRENGLAVLPILQILVFIYALRVVASPAFQVLNGLNFPYVTTFTSLTAGAGTIVLIYLLVPRYGLVGAAWANSASWISFYLVIFLLSYLQKKDTRA